MRHVLKSADWFHPDGFPIAVERRNPQQPYGLHTHEFSEIVIITGGSGMHVTGKDARPLSKGDVFVITGHRAHEYREMNQLCLINLLFQPEKLEFALSDLPTLPGYHALFTMEPGWRWRRHFKSWLHLTPQELAVMEGHADRLDEELRARAPGFRYLASAQFMQIVGLLSRCYSRSRHPDSRALLRMAEAISHLEAQFQRPVELEELARIAHMSRRSFLRAFQAATGNTPIAYLIQLRIQHAATLLRRSEESITEVAFSVGFNDSNYFTRQFVKCFGVSPRVYRQQSRRPGGEEKLR